MKNKQIIKKNANNIVWVQYWIEHMNPEIDFYEITGKEVKKGEWHCDIHLPNIEKDVTGKGSNEIDAMINACDIAAKLIKEFEDSHPELKVRNPFTKVNYEIYESENGGVIIGMSEEDRRREGEGMMRMQTESMNKINAAIDEIRKTYGMTDQLFLKVIDKKVYPNMKLDEIVELHEMDISKNTDRELLPFLTYEKDGYVIILGHLGRKA